MVREDVKLKMAQLGQMDDTCVEAVMRGQEKIEASYESVGQVIGEGEKAAFLTTILQSDVCYYLDADYVELLGDTYVQRTQSEDKLLERKFLLNPNVLERGSSYAKAIIRLNRSKKGKDKRQAYEVFATKETIQNFGDYFGGPITNIVPFQKQIHG